MIVVLLEAQTSTNRYFFGIISPSRLPSMSAPPPRMSPSRFRPLSYLPPSFGLQTRYLDVLAKIFCSVAPNRHSDLTSSFRI